MKDFVSRVTNHTMVNEQMHFFMRGFRRDAHPMAVMTGLVGALSAFYPDSMNLHDARERDISAIRPHRQAADAGRDGVQVFGRPAVHVPAQRPLATRRTSCG